MDKTSFNEETELFINNFCSVYDCCSRKNETEKMLLSLISALHNTNYAKFHEYFEINGFDSSYVIVIYTHELCDISNLELICSFIEDSNLKNVTPEYIILSFLKKNNCINLLSKFYFDPDAYEFLIEALSKNDKSDTLDNVTNARIRGKDEMSSRRGEENYDFLWFQSEPTKYERFKLMLKKIDNELQPEVQKYVVLSAKIYRLLVDEGCSLDKDSLVAYSWLLAAYYYDLKLAKFFKSIGITKDDIKSRLLVHYIDDLDYLEGRYVKRDELENIFYYLIIDTYIPIKKITLDDVQNKLTDSNSLGSSLYLDLFYSQTKKVLIDKFWPLVEKFMEDKQIQEEKEVEETLFKGKTVEIYNYIKDASNIYLKLSKDRYTEQTRVELSLLLSLFYSSKEYKDGTLIEYLKDKGITFDSIVKFYEIKDLNPNTEFNQMKINVVKEHFSSYLTNNSFSTSIEGILLILVNLLNSISIDKYLSSINLNKSDFDNLSENIEKYLEKKKQIKISYLKNNKDLLLLLTSSGLLYDNLSDNKASVRITNDSNELLALSFLLSFLLIGNKNNNKISIYDILENSGLSLTYIYKKMGYKPVIDDIDLDKIDIEEIYNKFEKLINELKEIDYGSNEKANYYLVDTEVPAVNDEIEFVARRMIDEKELFTKLLDDELYNSTKDNIYHSSLNSVNVPLELLRDQLSETKDNLLSFECMSYSDVFDYTVKVNKKLKRYSDYLSKISLQMRTSTENLEFAYNLLVGAVSNTISSSRTGIRKILRKDGSNTFEINDINTIINHIDNIINNLEIHISNIDELISALNLYTEALETYYNNSLEIGTRLNKKIEVPDKELILSIIHNFMQSLESNKVIFDAQKEQALLKHTTMCLFLQNLHSAKDALNATLISRDLTNSDLITGIGAQSMLGILYDVGKLSLEDKNPDDVKSK